MVDPVTGEYKGPPRWVKKSAITAVNLVLLFAIHFFSIGGISAMHPASTPQ